MYTFSRLEAPLSVRFASPPDLMPNRLAGDCLSPKIVGELVNDVMARQEHDATVTNARRGSVEIDPVLQTLAEVVSGFLSGEDLSPHHEKVRRYISHQRSRAELIGQLTMAKDYTRLLNYSVARDKLEAELFKAASRGDLNPSEALAFMQLVQKELDTIQRRVNIGASDVTDVRGLLEKVDYAFQQGEEEIRAKFKNTTPLGREIVRRVIHQLVKTEKAVEKP